MKIYVYIFVVWVIVWEQLEWKIKRPPIIFFFFLRDGTILADLAITKDIIKDEYKLDIQSRR